MKQSATVTRRRQGKGSRQKGSGNGQPAAKPKPAPAPIAAEFWDLNPRQWQIACAAILTIATLLRLLWLTMNPFHHDEGVNGFFMTSLFREGHYHYDPANYHGPTLYYLALVTTTINSLFFGKDGLSELALRLVPALFGIGVVWLILQLRRNLGTIGTLSAALLFAVSPASVYYSRYFIHEIPLIFFTLGIIVSFMRFFETGKAHYILLMAASAAMVYSTKETWIIIFPGLILSGLGAVFYRMAYEAIFVPRSSRPATASDNGSTKPAWSGQWLPYLGLALSALILFATISVLFYSSFFTNFPQGVKDSLATLNVWTKTAKTDDVHEVWTFLKWLSQEEILITILGAMGIITAFIRGRNRFALFVSIWALGTFAAYSHIPYKTPWLLLNFLLPLALSSGYLIQSAYELYQAWQWQLAFFALWVIGIAATFCGNDSRAFGSPYMFVSQPNPYPIPVPGSWIALAVIVPSVIAFAYGTMVIFGMRWPKYWRTFCLLIVGSVFAFSIHQTTDLNFVHYDDNDNPYIYAHTVRDFLNLIEEIKTIGALNGTGYQTTVMVGAPEYWPMPWYMRNYPNVGYWGRIDPANKPDQQLVIIRQEDQGDLAAQVLAGSYQRFNAYEMRPGNTLILYVKNGVRTNGNPGTSSGFVP